MTDWHSHILPAMDDGSKSVDESVQLLSLLHEQGVGQVVATPHFYANDESVDRFLKRRKKSYEELLGKVTQVLPHIYLGAEVKYYQGISHMADLEKLCVEGTNILLLEMPFCKWSVSVINELFELANMARVKIMLAHIERYFSMQSKTVWRNLYEGGVLMQVNASAVLGFGTKRKIIKFLKTGGVLFVGSDCHNLTSRSPRLGQALSIFEKKLGGNYCFQMKKYWISVLSKQNSRHNSL